MTTYDDDVVVAGAISAGNIHATSVWITPEPNVPTTVEITGLSLRGSGPVQAQATAHTTVPGLRVIEVGVSSVSPSGCQVWLYRTTAVDTEIYVILWRDQ